MDLGLHGKRAPSSPASPEVWRASWDLKHLILGISPGLTAADRSAFTPNTWSQQRFGTLDRGNEVLDSMKLPFGCMAEPRELANLVAFAALPRTGCITGNVLTIDGGAAHRDA